MQVFPGTLNSFGNPAGTQTLDNPDHAGQHGDLNDAVEAHEAVLGTTAGTSTLKNFSAGQFPLRMDASGSFANSISGGTWMDAKINLPWITAGTIDSVTMGTPAITGGTANNITLGTPAITGGTANNLNLGTPVISNPYKFRAYRSAALNTANATLTKVALDAESFDTNSNFATSTYTVPVAGFYQFNGRIEADHDGFFQLWLYKNGTKVSGGGADFYDLGQSSGESMSDFIQCAANDTIELWNYCDGIKAFIVGSEALFFSGFLVSQT